MSAYVAQCLVTGGGGELCQRPQGHDGWHYAQKGAGSASWGHAFPRWDGTLARWVEADEPEYEAGLKRLRDVGRRIAASRERQNDGS